MLSLSILCMLYLMGLDHLHRRYQDLMDHPKYSNLKMHPMHPFGPSTPPIQGSPLRSGCFLESGTPYSNLRYRLMYSNLESRPSRPLCSHLRGWALYWNLGTCLLCLGPGMDPLNFNLMIPPM